MSSLIRLGLTPLLQGFPLHCHHEFWELVYYCKGEGTIIVDGVEIPFTKGTLVCIPPHAMHEEISPKGFKNYHVCVADFPLDKKDIVFTDNATRDLQRLVEMLYRTVYIHEEASLNTPLAQSLLDAFLNTILANINSKNKYVEQMINSIILNISNPQYRISEAYEGIPMSCDHLRRLFISQVGMTPTEYLLDKRIGQAQRMLYSGNQQSIKQVAFLCGFADQYYFSRAFKKHTGVSPAKYAHDHQITRII
jgi:AraC-like DNA-binding protein